MALAIANKHWLVLGLGDTGLSLTRWLMRHGARVRVADTRDKMVKIAYAARSDDRHRNRIGYGAGQLDVEAFAGAVTIH